MNLKLLVVLLLASNIASMAIAGIVTVALPLKDSENRKRIIGIGVPLAAGIVAGFFCASAAFAFSVNPITAVRNCLTLNCSCQDIGRFAFSCALCLLLTISVFGSGYLILRKKRDDLARFKKKSAVLILGIAALVPVLFGLIVSNDWESNLILSEVCRKYTANPEPALSGAAEEIDESYIAIGNKGELACEITEVFLSDDLKDVKQIAIRNVTLRPGETFVQTLASSGDIHLKKQSGSVLYLADPQGEILDSVEVPPLQKNESYKRTAGGWVLERGTEEAAGESAVEKPVFSVSGGFYPEAFELSLSAPAGVEIRYTLDGSQPDEESERYASPIFVYDRSSEPNQYRAIENVVTDYKRKFKAPEAVDKAFVVRALCIDENGRKSETVTNTYFVNLNRYREGTVVSLVADPDDLFDADTGIYVSGRKYDEWYQKKLNGESTDTEEDAPAPNWERRGDSWERSANIEVLSEGKTVVNQWAGIKLQGRTSKKYALKRFSVIARKKYSGSSVFDAELFEGRQTHSVVLREGFMNAFIMDLVKERNVATQSAKPVSVFLDGEFWYDTYMIEKYSSTCISQTYGVSKDNALVVRIGSSPSKDQKPLIQEVFDFYRENDLSDPGNYLKYNQLIDLQSYIDFLCINAYVGNHDRTDTHNVLMWKTYIDEGTEYGDTRWRFGLYDMDLELSSVRKETGVATDAEVNTFTEHREDKSVRQYNQLPMFVELMKSELFRKQYVLTFMDMVNTVFSVENVEKALNNWGQNISYDDYFFLNRAQYIVPYMAEEFGLTGTLEKVSLSSDRDHAPVLLNTLDFETDGVWTGTYFTDYPITVSTDAPGFDHWVITSDGTERIVADPTLEVFPEKGGVRIHAVFK